MVQGFAFDERLNVRFLNSTYEGNLTYASDLFEIYVRTKEESMRRISQPFLEKNWENARRQLHIHKPYFAMVGLVYITEMMITLEHNIEKYIEAQKTREIMDDFNAIETAIQQTFPIIEKEYQRMMDHLAQYPTLTSR